MKIFQLDECLNSKRLAASCMAGQQCVAHRFPNRFKGKSIKDPIVLEYFFALGKPIVTNDCEMLSEHLESIPEKHPGLIVVTFSDECHDELTDTASASILYSFKQNVPAWAQLPCENSVLVITEKSVEILHKEAGALRPDVYHEYVGQIAEPVSAALDRNSRRLG